MSKAARRYAGQGRILTIQEPILKFLEGDHVGTLYMCQIMYWADIMAKKGKDWFYKTDQSFEEELYIPARTLQRLRHKYITKGYIETKIKKLPNGDTALHYRLTDKLNLELEIFLNGGESEQGQEDNLSVGNPENGNPGSPNCQVRSRQIGEPSHIQKMSFTEDEHKKKDTAFSLDNRLQDFKSRAPSGGDFALPEEQEQSKVKSKSNSASQAESEGSDNIDNYSINNNSTFTGTQSEAVIAPVGGAAAVAWIAALNDKTGSSYPAAAGFVKAYQRAQKQNNLTDDQLLLVIDNAIASGLAGTWLNPSHLLRNALNFAFAAKAKPKSNISIKTTDTDYSKLQCMQGHVYLQNPADNPHALKVSIADGYASGAIVDGQTVWHLNGTETQIYREYLIWKESNPDVKKTPDRWLSSNQPWKWLDNPADNPYARQIDTKHGFKTGAIVDGQTVWGACGSKSCIFS